MEEKFQLVAQIKERERKSEFSSELANRKTKLIEKNLRGSDLRGVDLVGANLSGVNLRYADLNGVYLSLVNVINTKFSNL
ncbi:MAG: pentapeptide repeat-containing protein [Trichodesmium erythraeum GBRTRLIN201]|nr:pentapeptide repeat-containing protein [Trichodesmium erythraeum GBRTRLIN201]